VSPARAAIQRGLLRAPSGLYDHHLGWLLGRRLLRLTHRGRRSGRIHRTVLEVIEHDPTTCESVVVSGPGPRADWYRNIRVEPALRVETGRLDYRPQQSFLTPEEARATAQRFACAHPLETRLAHPMLRALGWIDGDAPRDAVELFASLPMVAFRPTPGPDDMPAGG